MKNFVFVLPAGCMGTMPRNAAIWWLAYGIRAPTDLIAAWFGINRSRVYQILAAVEAKMAHSWPACVKWEPPRFPWADRLLAANALEGRLNQGPELE